MRYFLICLMVFSLSGNLFSQTEERKEKVLVNGNLLTMWITETGDTLFMANLDDVSVTAPVEFNSQADRNLYRRYRRYAVKVYPYAVEAIKVFREVEHLSEDLPRRKRKKRMKKLQRDLEEKFEEPLKKLSKKQGYVLMKMIERELETPMYKLIKNLRGGFTATYWSTFARLYGHKLREGYTEGDDPILDPILKDFDVSYSLPSGADLEQYEKYFGDKKKAKEEKSTNQ